ncbi:MAG: HAMP domain-containing histidine kinase [Erysipelotrichaceae bacterium]|nr:HAMP domain-containing histidine kinase [Erysipelotrichaceae bacterium]
MRKIQNWLGELSLTQQLLAIIMFSFVMFIFLFFVYLRGNIQDFGENQTYDLIERSQTEMIRIYNENLIQMDGIDNFTSEVSHLFVKEGNFYAFVGTYLNKQPLMELYNSKILPGGVNAESSFELNSQVVYYKVTELPNQMVVVSFMDDDYRNEMVSILFDSISNMAALVVGTIYLLLILWVSFLLRPLNQIRTYIERIRNGEDAKLNIERNDEIGEVAFALVNMRDELMHQDQVKEEMIHNISHDLKTPIATIKSYGESIKDGIYPYETLEKSVDVIIDNAERLEKKVHSLLVLNRLDYLLSSTETEWKDIEMKSLVELVVLSLHVVRPEIEMKLEMEPTTFRGEEESWRILVENLLDNAIRYAKSEIVITLKEGYLSVYNDGSSISQETMNKMFKPYEKGSKGKFGLGLSICNKVVNAYGYSLEAQNMEFGVIFRVKDRQDPKLMKKKKVKKG